MELPLVHRTIPARTGAAPHPALLLLHGRGTNEADLLGLGPQLDDRLFTVSARAPFQFPWGGYAWYDLDPSGVGYPDNRSLRESLDLLRRFIDGMVTAFPIDPARVYVAGFSMGSVMTGALGLLDPERVAGAMILSGYLPLHNDLPFRLEEAAGHPFFQGHGTLDQVIPVRFGRETAEYLAQTPVDLTYREYPIGHEIGPQELEDMRGWMRSTLDASQSAKTPSEE